jgi:anti-sigma28 factor (negative regulator of flagellin synthesis)
MSMKIQNDGLNPAAASPAPPSEGLEQAGSSTSARSPIFSGADQVSISSLSGSLASSAGALAQQHAARVSHLAALYAKGAYQPDSMQISRALISGAIAAGSLQMDN